MDLSPDVNVPEPTPEERALQTEQVEILRQQRDIIKQQARQQELLAPLLFEQSGIRPIYSEAETIRNPEIRDIRTELRTLREELAGLPAGTYDTEDDVIIGGGVIPSSADRAQLESQIATLEQQLRDTPRRITTDPRIIGFERIEDPNEALRREIETGLLERSRAALAGELPV